MADFPWGVDERLVRAHERYELATFGGDSSQLAQAERELDAVAADVALGRGRVLHARFLERRFGGQADPAGDRRELELFEEALRLFDEIGDVRGQGEALFLIGCFHQVVMDDEDRGQSRRAGRDRGRQGRAGRGVAASGRGDRDRVRVRGGKDGLAGRAREG